MKSLIAAALLAVTALFNYKKTVSDLQEAVEKDEKTIAARDLTITEKDAKIAELADALAATKDDAEEIAALKQQVEDNATAAVESAKVLEEVKARNTELEGTETQASEAAKALADAMEAHPNLPTVDPVTFAVVEPGDPLEEAA